MLQDVDLFIWFLAVVLFRCILFLLISFKICCYAYTNPKLFDPSIDVNHKSYLWVVVGTSLRDVAVTFYQSATTHQCKVDSHVIVFFTCSLHALRFIYFILINCVMYFVVGCISHCMLEVTVEPG
jgi:hypothetical protein